MLSLPRTSFAAAVPKHDPSFHTGCVQDAWVVPLASLAAAWQPPLDIGREAGGVVSAEVSGFGAGCSENARGIAGTGVEARVAVVEADIEAIGEQRLRDYVDAERAPFGGPGPGPGLVAVAVAVGTDFVVSVHCWPGFALQLPQDSESSSQLAAAAVVQAQAEVQVEAR